jgi:hypothetical protein
MSTETSDQMSTADLVDLHGEALQSIPLQLRSFGPAACVPTPRETGPNQEDRLAL